MSGTSSIRIVLQGCARPALASSLMLAGVLGSLAAPTAQAALYRCTGSAGETVFSQSPCPAGVAATHGDNDDHGSLDCRIARGFMRHHATAMLHGTSQATAVSDYGGSSRMSATATGIVDYIYSFHGNRSASAGHITDLGMKRCTAGSFGRVDCSVFPSPYIRASGGCRAAAQNSPVLGAALPQGTAGHDSDANWLRAPTPGVVKHESPGHDRPTGQAPSGAVCTARVNRQIAGINERLDRATSANEVGTLQQRLRELNSQRYDCY